MKTFVFIVVITLIATSSLASGAVLTTSLGNTAPGFADGSFQTTLAVNNAQTGEPAPFTGNCGSDASLNCSANWTFTYSIPSGDTIVAANLILGIWDIDSGAPNNQVASYTLTGGDDLTSLLNTVAEALNGGAGSNDREYDVLSVMIPSSSFTHLAGGTAQISLALQGQGLGANPASPNTTFNGAKLVFSTLEITAAEPTPEPSYFALVPMALGALALLRRRPKIY